ncbi:hypothetical protein IKS38_05940 [bacterium]|nr:hypothetical protein [bacterium]
MARQRKDYISLHMKVDADLMRKFNAYCDEVGQTKTMAFERIVSMFFDEREANKQIKMKNGKR